MEDKDWFWQDDSYTLDTEYPLVISRSLWDGLAQSEADSRLATTPATEVSNSDHLVSTFSRQVGLDAEVDAGCSMYDASNSMQECSPRSKRRRMLLFPGANEELEVSDTAFDAGLDSSYGIQCAAMIPSSEVLNKDDAAMVPSASSLWYQNDDPHLALNEVPDPQKWMVRSFDELPENEPCDLTKTIIPFSNNSGSCSDYQQPSSCESDAMDWPSTPFAQSPNPGRRHNAHTRPKLVTPVAYPFALLKPCGAQGDVTLNDINQRIARPPSQPHLAGGDCRPSPPQSSMSQPGGSPGRTGKSVVGLTKIHTEGNGTITIVRTRGG